MSTTSDSRMEYQPIHPELLPRLLPEYVKVHNQSALYQIPIQDLPWDPECRKAPPVQGGSTPLKVGSVNDYDLSKCQVRVFTPEGEAPSQGWPVFLFFHGGEHRFD